MSTHKTINSDGVAEIFIPQNESVGESPPQGKPNAWVRFWRRMYHPLGFRKGYNFPLFIIFAGAMLGFSLARLQFLDISGRFAQSAAPGEWYWFRHGLYRVGITLHLGCVLPAAFLMVWQFVPVIRHKFLLFHRINGYIVMLLILVSNVGAMIIARRSFNGDLSTQLIVGVLTISTTGSLGIAYYNIKRLQIEQHRAWMLRCMFYCGTVITQRLIFFIAPLVISDVGTYYTTTTCDELNFLYSGYESAVRRFYPECFGSSILPQKYVVVHADYNTPLPETIAASLWLTFGMTTWLAFFLHAVGIEIYLSMTPREANYLRHISYEKQLEAGFRNPGSAGLVVEKFGDAETWVPSQKEQS